MNINKNIIKTVIIFKRLFFAKKEISLKENPEMESDLSLFIVFEKSSSYLKKVSDFESPNETEES
jgi:hypothetical protein